MTGIGQHIDPVKKRALEKILLNNGLRLKKEAQLVVAEGEKDALYAHTHD